MPIDNRKGFALVCIIIFVIFAIIILSGLWWLEKSTLENQTTRLNQDMEQLRIKIHSQSESRGTGSHAS